MFHNQMLTSGRATGGIRREMPLAVSHVFKLSLLKREICDSPPPPPPNSRSSAYIHSATLRLHPHNTGNSYRNIEGMHASALQTLQTTSITLKLALSMKEAAVTHSVHVMWVPYGRSPVSATLLETDCLHSLG